ncbi:GtrA family protein [Patescibacteria group bacterium]
MIGSLTTGLDFLFLYVLVEYFHLFYMCSAIISIVIIFTMSYLLNKYWTFNNQEKNHLQQLTKYTSIHLIAWIINLAILTILVEIFGMWYLFAKVFATAVAFLWNYFFTKNWVFKKVSLK